MPQEQQANKTLRSSTKPGFAGTDAEKVKQEIQKGFKRGTRCNDGSPGGSNERLRLEHS